MWNTKATESIPTPAMAQLISMAPGAVTEAMFWGREKIPAPTVEPMMSATSVHMGTERVLSSWGFPRVTHPIYRNDRVEINPPAHNPVPWLGVSA